MTHIYFIPKPKCSWYHPFYDHKLLDLFKWKNVPCLPLLPKSVDIDTLLKQLITRFPNSTFSVLVFPDRLKKVRFLKFRPHFFGEIKLRVRTLPQQKITQSFFTARSDQ